MSEVRSFLLGAGMALGVLAGHAASAAPADASLVAQGEYLARAGDCAACHTAAGGKPFAGGLPFKLPIGTIYSSNITPDKAGGIGSYTEAEFAKAVRQGVRKDGSTLYPAMPFPSYARVSDADIHALYAYFMQGVQPVAAPTRTADISWPLSMRWPLTVWRWAFAPATPSPAAPPRGDPELVRGAYLVEGLGHCGACHTERGLALEEKALTARDGGSYLAGSGPVEGWVPPTLRANALTGLGAWSEADIAAFLKTGRNAHGSVFGSMSPVVEDSTQYMTDADLTAMAHYLKSLSPDTSGAAFAYDDATAKALFNGDTGKPGALAYVNNCASCHRSDGKGYPGVFPKLAGNPVLQGQTADGIIRIVLLGSTVPATFTAPASFTMPGFAGRMDDQQVADVVNFIRTGWGNSGSKVTPSQVAAVRKTLPD